MANASGPDSNASNMIASSLQVWGEHLQAKALEDDLRKRAHDTYSEFKSFFTEGFGGIIELIREQQELSRKVAFFEQLLKFKGPTEIEDASVESMDFDNDLDENCIALLKKAAEEMVSSVVIKNVQHAEEDAHLCIEEMAKSGKFLEGSVDFELSKLYVETKLVHMACRQEVSSISAVLKDIGNASQVLECITLMRKKGCIPVRGGSTSGYSSLNTYSGPGCTEDVLSLK